MNDDAERLDRVLAWLTVQARAILLQHALPDEQHCPYCGGFVAAA